MQGFNGAKVRNGIEHHWSYGIEDSLIVLL